MKTTIFALGLTLVVSSAASATPQNFAEVNSENNNEQGQEQYQDQEQYQEQSNYSNNENANQNKNTAVVDVVNQTGNSNSNSVSVDGQFSPELTVLDDSTSTVTGSQNTTVSTGSSTMSTGAVTNENQANGGSSNSTAQTGSSRSGASALGGSGGSSSVRIDNRSNLFPVIPTSPVTYSNLGGGVVCPGASAFANVFGQAQEYGSQLGAVAGITVPLGSSDCKRSAGIVQRQMELQTAIMEATLRGLQLDNLKKQLPEQSVIIKEVITQPIPEVIVKPTSPKPQTGTVRGLW